MEYKLDYFFEGESKSFLLTQAQAVIGKLPENDLQLRDETVSRRHCQVVRSGAKYKLVDLKSTNGTFVNGKRVGEKVLAEGDVITVGYTQLIFSAVSREATFQETDDQRISMVVPLADLSRKVEQPEAVAEEANFLAAMVQLGKSLITSQSLGESFERITECISEYIKPEKIAIFSYDDKRDDVEMIHFHSTEKKKKSQIRISKTIALKAIHEKVAILSANTREDQRFDRSKSIIIYGITSVISVPIWTKDSIYGLIYIDTTSFGQIFLERDLQMMSVIANLAGFAIEGQHNIEKLNREKKIRSRFERYHSPAVVSRLMEFQDDKSEVFSHRESEASVLFLDIVRFTSRAEHMSPMEVGLFLNYFFSEMTEIIFRHQGTLDKFIGDAVMALFGVPLALANHACVAIAAALEMMERVGEMNKVLPEKEPIRVRIGINSGKVIDGDFGSPKRLEYTVLGNTVNIASRLESSVAGEDEIVVTEAVYLKTKDLFAFEPLGGKNLSGISVPVKVYRVIGKKGGKT